MKKKFFKIINIFVLSISLCSAQFLIEEVNFGEYEKKYNSLFSVDESVKKTAEILNSESNFYDFLNQCRKIVESYKLESYIGFRLNHKHYDLGKGELMAESFSIVDHIPSLITQAYKVEKAIEENMVPASWILNYQNNSLTINPFEFSNDISVIEGNRRLQEEPKFMIEIANKLKEFHLENSLSLAILKRNSLTLLQGQAYLEKSDSFGGVDSSIITIVSTDEMPKDGVNTAWYLKDATQHGCRTTTKCDPRYDDGGHDLIFEHSYYNEDRILSII